MSTPANNSVKLAQQPCIPCTAATPPLTQARIATLLAQLDGWVQQDHLIGKTFRFSNYYQTMSFVNATAWISNQTDHHPELTVGYNKCHVEYTTHAINGLSENDFICAARVDALLTA